MPPENRLRQLSHVRRVAVGRSRVVHKPRTSGGAVLTGGKHGSGKVLPEIMIIGI